LYFRVKDANFDLNRLLCKINKVRINKEKQGGVDDDGSSAVPVHKGNRLKPSGRIGKTRRNQMQWPAYRNRALCWG